MSQRLPVISGEEAAAALQRAGYARLKGRGKGSHIVMHHSGESRMITIPNHN